MSEPTKTCSLTKDEVLILIKRHGFDMTGAMNAEPHIERINYLNKRLKSFDEVEIVKESPSDPQTTKGWA